ncbi:MAG: hypothetical protein V3V75_00735 [Thermoguttaceae bacterium]
MDEDLKERMTGAALAFRGYNVTNLGRSGEFLRHPAYGKIARQYLTTAGDVCAEVTGKPVDLVARVRRGREAPLRLYAEAVTLVVAMELAQVQMLRDIHGIKVDHAKIAMGYSLGEVTAVCCGGLIGMEDVLRIPLSMAKDCAELSKDVTLGVLFSRGPALDMKVVNDLCQRLNTRGKGVIGVSSILSPNTVLLLGQKNTINQFKNNMGKLLHPKIHLRINPRRWPPLHTPIMWQRSVPNRAAVMMHTIPIVPSTPRPPVLSLVTGRTRYNESNTRDLLHRWVDHPQRLWDGVYRLLTLGVETVIHIGPEPNLVPATFKRLSANVQEQVSGRSLGSLGLRAASAMVSRQWLGALLPKRTALLRAPKVRHIILEDWLLDQPVP